jgi:hypothetical protein
MSFYFETITYSWRRGGRKVRYSECFACGLYDRRYVRLNTETLVQYDNNKNVSCHLKNDPRSK